MNATNANIVKYIGGLFNLVPGGFMGLLEELHGAYDGNMIALMRDLSGTGVFQSTLVPGSDRDVAHDLVNRFVGDSVPPADKAWAVGWFADQKAAGLSWGEIMYTAISILDTITTGVWAGAADQMRARAAYAAHASENWAAGNTDFWTLRDVYSYATPPVAKFTGLPNLEPLTRLNAASSALATAAANGSQGGSQNHTVSNSDTGKALLMGAGDDSVTVSYADLLKPVFVSGGDGFDTLVIRDGAGFGEFVTNYQGVMSTLPYRGFEKILLQDAMPFVVGSIDGVKEFGFSSVAVQGGVQGFDVKFGSVDNGTIFDIDLRPGAFGRMKFFDFPPFNAVEVFGKQPGAQTSAAQLVDSLTFNAKVGAAGSLFVPDVPARNLTVNVDSALGAASQFDLQLNDMGQYPSTLPNLESLTLASNVNTNLTLVAPLRALDLHGSAARVELSLTSTGGALNDGFVDNIAVSAPQGLFALRWESTAPRVDSYFDFTGQFKAGSSLHINYMGLKAPSMPTTKIVFNSDFSEVGYYNAQQFGPLGNTKAAGSSFEVLGAENAAVYFKGIAAPGQTIGTLGLSGLNQSTTVKVDSGAGIEVVGGSQNAVTVFINSGQGSVLNNIRASVDSMFAELSGGKTVNEMTVAGGRILWGDSNQNGKLDGLVIPAGTGTPWKTGFDLVFMETTNVDLATFNQSIQLLGFNPVVDPFL